MTRISSTLLKRLAGERREEEAQKFESDENRKAEFVPSEPLLGLDGKSENSA